MATIIHEVARAYRHGLIDTGKQAELLLLLSFLLSFGFIRTSAHLIRSQRFSWWPGNVEMGGISGSTVVGVLLAVVCVLKGKRGLAVASVLVPLVGAVGAVRLARPGSIWAPSYGEGRSARARERFGA